MLPRARMWWRSRGPVGDAAGTDAAAGLTHPSAERETPSGGPPARTEMAVPQGGNRRPPRPSSPDAMTAMPPLTLRSEAMTAPPVAAPASLGHGANGAPANWHTTRDAGPLPVEPAPIRAASQDQAPMTDETGPALYLAHFGLHARPFTLVPDPSFLFWSRAHRRAYSILEYGIMTRAPITLVTGEVGAGKTTLIHHLLRRLETDVRVGLVSNAHGARGEVLRWILMALAQPAPEGADHVALFSAFQSLVIAEYAAGRRVVLIFDEAQNLGRDVLEELRLLTNINANGDELLQLILVGQPELRDIIQRPDMAQFSQRVAARFHLPAMESETVRAYIEHRLSVAGAPYMLFEEEAVACIHRETRGVPRLVNQLCDLALVYAYTEDARAVSRATVANVIADGVFVAGSAPPGSAAAAEAREAASHD